MILKQKEMGLYDLHIFSKAKQFFIEGKIEI